MSVKHYYLTLSSAYYVNYVIYINCVLFSVDCRLTFAANCACCWILPMLVGMIGECWRRRLQWTGEDTNLS